MALSPALRQLVGNARPGEVRPGDAGYVEKYTEIYFPPEVERAIGHESLTVSIRDILTMLAAKNAAYGSATAAAGYRSIRDRFYADDEVEGEFLGGTTFETECLYELADYRDRKIRGELKKMGYGWWLAELDAGLMSASDPDD